MYSTIGAITLAVSALAGPTAAPGGATASADRAAAGTSPIAAHAIAGQDREFRWTGRLARGKTLEIRGVNGGIRAERASGDQIEVTATKTGRKSDPSTVNVEVVQHDDGVTICAVYPTPEGERPNECRPGGGHMNTRNNDVRVEFTVRVPAGVRFLGRTVNGRIVVGALDSDVDVSTVNGAIDVSAGAIVEARTVNGSIDATLRRADWSGELDFSTVNGSITLTLPSDLSAEVTASTVNGHLSSDFPLTVQGRFSPRRLVGTIGEGGRGLHLKTVNGSITLRRS